MLTLANQTVAVVGTRPGVNTRSTWRPDGSQLTFVTSTGDASGVWTLLAPLDVRYSGSGITFTPKPDVTVPGFAGWGELPAYTADGMVLRIFGPVGATSPVCTFLDRLASDLSQQVGTFTVAEYNCPFGHTMSPLVGRRN